ncbi:hypothetical protein A1O1_06034 [Capronia coronata CBS 617.96]|uniref:Cytochrome P450 n=1 Tax=Capronia coronata CBS 617.96 TaxID=1182541 RepID=W9XZK2_9EURO|nr:uncharacterized protein A1O1_06034 [Capronia coronata CBS 617.96]EXJ85668.1 hypothetical protein A1O1_06034 [Capronia coronata CBS 617.96]
MVQSPLLLGILCLAVFYVVGLSLYRIYLSPVAHVPGPWLAKATYWYEFYYDVVQQGQYTFKIKQLHEQYGPIVRINPEEVHVADADFYDVIYAGSSQRRDKWAWFCQQFGIPDSAFATVKHEHHRLRRQALNPFFSKAKVRSLQPLIEEVAHTLLARFEDFRQQGQPLTVSLAFAALTNDIAEQYALGRNDNRVSAKDFDPSFHDASVAGARMGHLTKQFPIIFTIMQALPDSVAVMMDPNMASYVKLQRDIKSQIELIQNNRDGEMYKGTPHHTIFHEILNSDLPAPEKSSSRLWQDGQVTIIAGTLTTASALSYTLFCLLTQPEILRRLKLELKDAIRDPAHLPPLAVIEQLPYLSACIKEGLRLSNGVSCRLQRIDPDNPIVFTDRLRAKGKQYLLPPGTPLSMTGMLIHVDPAYFPDPFVFNPDRWLNNPGLDKYLVPFSRGTRQCIGMNLAYAEIYVTLALVLRSYGSPEVSLDDDKGYLELYDTEWHRDLEIVGDGVTPLNRPESKGVRILVR